MPKPYSLNLYSSVIGANEAFVTPLTPHAKGWKRSWRAQGGCWQGSFTWDGEFGTHKNAFENWLGYHVVEKVGGLTSWSGLIYEMDLTKNGITRRRTLDLMSNRVKATYLTMDFTGNNLIENASFEMFTGVGPPTEDFYSWGENAGTNGTVTRSATAHTGASSVRLDADSDLPTGWHLNTYIRQHLEITPGTRYRLKFWTLGDGGTNHSNGRSGMYAIRNPNAPTSWLVGPVETHWYSNTVWKEITITFVSPSEGEIFIFFVAPYYYNAVPLVQPYALFDDVELLEEAQCVYGTRWGDEDEDPTQSLWSMARYGVKEEIVHLDNYPEDTSIAYRDTYLAEHCWPWPRPVTVTNPGETRLDIFVAGYVHTMNWMYVMTGDGAGHDLDDWIALMCGTEFGRDPLHGGDAVGAGDCQFIKAGNIQANTLQVPQLTGVEERPWDVISELASLGDAAGNPWQAWVGPQRSLHYMPIDINPHYYIRKDGVYDTMAGNAPSNPWLMRPAVFRDMTYRGAAEAGSFLTSTRDMWVEEVEMADGWSRPALKTALFSESELLSARTERGE